MSKLQLKQEQKALEKQPELNLSSEAQVFLAFKYKRSNRYELLGQVTRANVILDNQLMDKTKFLHPKACIIAEIILNKLSRNGTIEVVLTHKQLGNLFEFAYQRKYLSHKNCYVLQLPSGVREILESSAVKKGGVL